MLKTLIRLLAIVAILSGCGNETTGAITNVSANEFAKVIETEKVVILDVRTPAEFMSGHIAGAINIDAESGNFANEIKSLDPNSTYAIYCRSGRRSGVASESMADAGFVKIYNMNGGTIDWEAAGFPLTTN